MWGRRGGGPACAVLAAAAALTLLPDTARGQTRNDEACVQVLAALGQTTESAAPCRTLAVLLNTELTAPLAALALDRPEPSAFLSPRDLQPRHTQHAGLSGTGAQVEALPSVRPVGIATGSLAVLGTDAGDDALAALGVNPAVLVVGDRVSEALARYARFMDLSFLVPVSDLSGDGGEEDDDIDYVGVRLRMNVHGLSQGSELWAGADALLVEWITAVTDQTRQIQALLEETGDVALCVEALRSRADDERLRRVCGGTVAFGFTEDQARRLQAGFAAIRRAVDDDYLGLDLRMDFGDPTLGAVPDASGTFLFAGLSAGRRYPATDGQVGYGVGGRLGVRHASLDAVEGGEFALEGTAGFDMVRRIADQEITASVALDLRYGGAPDGMSEAFQTDYTLLRASLVVPVAGGNTLGVSFGNALDGDVSTSLSVNFNWGLLLPDEVAGWAPGG